MGVRATSQTAIVAGQASASGPLGIDPPFLEFFHQRIAVFALNLDHPIHDPTSGTAALFERFGEGLQVRRQ